MRKYFYYFTLLCFITTEPLWATSTGLNNIPTADVVPENVLVFQFISDMANIETPNNSSAVQSNRAFVTATRHKNS
jgi:hypothetical protein